MLLCLSSGYAVLVEDAIDALSNLQNYRVSQWKEAECSNVRVSQFRL